MGLGQILNRIQRIESIKRIYEASNSGVQMQWETNIEKMQFNRLRSYGAMKGFFEQEILRVENIDITNNTNIDYGLEYGITGDAESYIDLIDIIMNGGKLIPPLTCESYAIVDGIEKMVRSPSFNGIDDGHHRVALAKYFGVSIIPTVVFKSINEYWFTPDKWSFGIGRIREEQQKESGIHYTEYNGIKATSKEGNEITFKNDFSIDESNVEYLIIRINKW